MGSGDPNVRDTTTYTEFPVADVIMSARNGLSVEITLNIRDAGDNFRGTDDQGATQLAASSTIASYDLMKAQSLGDPGRDRSAWTMIDQIAYADAAVSGHFQSIACDEQTTDAWLAVGITFVGDIESAYVGQAIALQCDPALADPGGRQLLDRETPSQRKTPKPTRARGTRGR